MMLGERRNNNFIQSLELCRPTCHTSSQADLEFDWFYLDLVQHDLQKGSWNHTVQIPHATQRQKGSAESTIPRRSHGWHADVLHFHQRACPFHICCSRRWGEMSKWWSVKQADSWNNPRLRKEKKRLRRTKLALSARSRRTGWKTELYRMKARDVSQQCHHRAEMSVEELQTRQKVHTWCADSGSFVWCHVCAAETLISSGIISASPE